MLKENQKKELIENGIIKIENFLTDIELKKLTQIVKYYSAPKSSPNSYWPTKFHQIILKILKLDFLRFKHSLEILNFEKEKKLIDYAKLAFNGKKTYLNYVDAYLSKKSKKNIIPWHTDQAYHGHENPQKYVDPNSYFIKVFIYLTDVTSKNGCMSYIPGSHKVGYAIRKGIYEGKIKYKPYWNLRDSRDLVLKNKEYFKNFFQDQFFIVQNFLDKSEFINKDDDTVQFDNNVKAGGALIFDEGGSHRGSSPTQGDRMVLRYMYSTFNN